MILTDREIEQSLSQSQTKIHPKPNLEEALSSTSLDLTLSNRFAEWKKLSGMPVRPGAKGFDYNQTVALQEQHTTESFTLNPHSFVLAWTHEEVTLPLYSRIAARVEGKSSLARFGVSVHVTAPTIHSGFTCNIQLEMFNFGSLEIILERGKKICHLIFETTFGTPQKGYQGIFAGQTPTSFSNG